MFYYSLLNDFICLIEREKQIRSLNEMYVNSKVQLILTLCDLNNFSNQFVETYCLRQTPVIYRLIDAPLIGNFFHDPFLFLNQNFGQTELIRLPRS